MPSSYKPSTDHVLTNSLGRLGTGEICVSRSAMWMTFVPVSMAKEL